MRTVRQAVVIVHGMGEQRPLDTLNRFVKAALVPRDDTMQTYYSQPDRVTDSFESRRLVAPRYAPGGHEAHAHTDFYEYHWAHLMQGNRLGDLWPTFRRLLLRPVWRVPAGLRALWVVFWAAIVLVAWWLVGDPGRVAAVSGLSGSVLFLAVARVLFGPLKRSFVDVVRYLDTSPRSYEVRRQIRKGMLDLLQGLHDSERYDRIVVVAHSLGAYIAYDGIAYLWAHEHKLHAGGVLAPGEPAGLAELERLASDLPATPSAAEVAAFQAAQRELWLGLREQGNPWLVTDFVSVGTPMYFADDLYARSRREFDERVARWELPTCPPQCEGGFWNNVRNTRLWFTWSNNGRRVLHNGAPFAAVRWTNMWFPARFGVFGDWFGGPLAPLFGPGIKDVPITGNGWKQRIPAVAHSKYFSFPRDRGPGTATTALHAAMDLASTAWLQPATDAPKPDPRTAAGSSEESEPGYGGRREHGGSEAADARPRRPRKGAGQHVDTGGRRRSR